ncbi:uncharacterized protein [Elaeis guineensis]|uniref:Uncharacterized protein LOC105059928 isoform X3 n=1 Tax=Elaeis guineensis var. tenera TaxID=51953 RepID=A0A6J0PSP3_ELAGV|nr:uncharacterized protein LOC105059928 isoform X3 [Elaeis guineensis]
MMGARQGFQREHRTGTRIEILYGALVVTTGNFLPPPPRGLSNRYVQSRDSESRDPTKYMSDFCYTTTRGERMSVPLFHLAPDLIVSRLCFGTMTFGEQNSLPQSFRLLDEAFEAGVNFFDSAEMLTSLSVSGASAKSYSGVEREVSRSLDERAEDTARPCRCGYQDATFIEVTVLLRPQVTGPSGQMTWIRGGPKSLDANNILEAIDNSYVPMFGETEYDPSRQYASVAIEEQLGALGKAVDAGKIRYIGLSNETPYGVMKFNRLAENIRLNSNLVSLQNSYNLLCRNFDSALAECCHHERISLLAYSPMAMGILSGKYYSLGGGPSDARLNLFRGRYSEGESRYNLSNPILKSAVQEYADIAVKYGLSPASLSIAFVLKHPLVASALFGATKAWQLREVLQASKIHLTMEIIAEINKVHARYPNPCP